MNVKKIEIYKRIRELKDLEEYTMLQDDLIDRFGEYPDEVADLLSIGLIKMHSEKALIEFIKRNNNQIDVTLSQSGTEKLPAEEVFKALGDIPLRANVAVKKEKLVVTFQLNNEPTYQWLDYLQKFAANVAAYFVEKSEASEK